MDCRTVSAEKLIFRHFKKNLDARSLCVEFSELGSAGISAANPLKNGVSVRFQIQIPTAPKLKTASKNSRI
jgi:hypothetical protein